jgi:branched-chain amino acid transport system substrate-binding protein
MNEQGRSQPAIGFTRRSLGLAAIGVAAAAALEACSSSGSSSSTTTTTAPLTIGMSLPLTGPVADNTKSGYEGYQLWTAQVNAAGGLLGRQVQLKVLDDGFDPSLNGANYTRLISQDKVDLLLGTFSSLLNAPASAIAARQRMLYIEPSGGSASLFTRGFTNLFFAQPTVTTHLPDQFVAWVTSLPAAQRPAGAAYITQDDPSTAPAVAVFKTKLEALGIKTLYNQTYDPSTTNFATIGSAVAHAAPDLIIHGAVADDGAQFIRALQQLSFNPKIFFQTNAPTDAAYPGAIGVANTAGIFTAAAWNAQSKYTGNADFVSAYTKKFGREPSEDAANSYTAGQVLAAAVRAVGSIKDQPALATWLHANTVDTIVGPLSWDATGVPKGTLLLGQWQSGTLKIVAPASAATSTQIVNPKPAWTTS